MMSTVPIVLDPVDHSVSSPASKPLVNQSAQGPFVTPVKPKASPSEKLKQRVSDAKKSLDFTPSPVRKNLQLDRRIQALVREAEATLDTSSYVHVGVKRNQRSGVLALESLHKEATNEYETLYAVYQSLLAQHTKLLADLTTIMKEAAAAEDLQRKRLEAIKAVTEAVSLEDLSQTVSGLAIDVAKTTELPQAIPILSTTFKVHPVTP